MMTPGNIIVLVSDYFKQPIDKVLSTSRKQEYVKVRQVSMYFIKLYIKGISLENTGKYFPGKTEYKDHASVLYGIKTVNGYIDTDKAYKKDIDLLDTRITSLFNIDSVLAYSETGEEKFARLWNEREGVWISENKHLKEEIIRFKNEVSKLQGLIYGLKLNKKKKRTKKREYLKTEFVPTTFKKPAENGREYHGYREHQL